MISKVILSLLVKAVYLLTYINYILFIGYFIFYLLGKVSPPLGVEQGDMFTLIVICIFAPALCHSCLYCRDRFDLVRMCDGTSAMSRFIWTALVFGLSSGLLHVFLRDFIQVY